MSEVQKNQKEGVDVGKVLDGAEAIDKVKWEDFWEKKDIEQDLQDAYKDMRETYQAFD